MEIKQYVDSFILERAEADVKKFSERLIFSSYPIAGLRTPDMKRFAKELAASRMTEFLDGYRPDTHEGIMIYGFVLTHIKDIDELLARLDKYIPLIDNWAVCDSVSMALKLFVKHREKVLEKYIGFKHSEKEFEKRWLILVLMCYFATDEYADFVLETYAGMPSGQYYTDMGIAWALSHFLIKYYDKTKAYLERKVFSKFTHNKAIQKARESFRIPQERKDYLNTLKI